MLAEKIADDILATANEGSIDVGAKNHGFKCDERF